MKKLEEKINEIIFLIEKINQSDLENHIRDHLSGTPRKVTPDNMFSLAKSKFKELTRPEFDKAWKGLVNEGYLKPSGGKTYKWEM